MKLRLLTPDDVDVVAAAHATAFDAPWTGAAFLGFLRDRGAFAIGVEPPEGELVGFILCRTIAGEAEVLTLAVRPEARRGGVGAALVEAAAGTAALYAEAMFLEVAEDNPGAIALYRRAGFEQVGRRAGYYGRMGAPKVDALVMRRALNT